MRNLSRFKNSSMMKAFRITIIYALIGSSWILVSDRLVNFFFHDPSMVESISILKGWVYVFATSLLIYYLVNATMKKLSSAMDDISDMNKELQRKEVFNKTVMDNLPIGIAVNTFPAFEFVYMNDRFPLFYRTDRQELSVSDAFWDSIFEDPDLRREFKKRVLADIASEDIKRMCWEDVPVTREGQEIKYISAYAAPVPGQNLIISTVIDVTERKKVEENLKYLSYHDHLTELFNRRFFEIELVRLDTARNLPVTIIMGDVNGLKLINDSFGHEAGDQLLKKIAKVIKDSCREDDIIARIGGDEFGILLPGTDIGEAEKIVSRIKSQSLDIGMRNSLVSVSFGYAAKNAVTENIQAVMVEAENYMYKHKMYESASMRNKTVHVIMNALFEKSERESLHSKRVSAISAAIASELGFSQDRINKIRISGLIHDIGKIGIDEKILNKPGKLTDEEWEEIKKHPEAGWRILSSVNEFSELAQYVLSHHERWDGKGYPKGLKDKDISIEASIISVADAYDAMTQDRPYRRGVTKDEAVLEIERNAGTQFDPHIVNIFLNSAIRKELDFLDVNNMQTFSEKSAR